MKNRINATNLQQSGALPVRSVAMGVLEVLLLTSRETRRWVVPKGWPMRGYMDHDAAAIEAFQEAGVLGNVRKQPLGTYPYMKRLSSDDWRPCRVTVYRLDVDQELRTWPEINQRKRRWCSLDEAASMVEEEELRAIIIALAEGESLREAG